MHPPLLRVQLPQKKPSKNWRGFHARCVRMARRLHFISTGNGHFTGNFPLAPRLLSLEGENSLTLEADCLEFANR